MEKLVKHGDLMPLYLTALLICLTGYLLGSLNSAILVTRLLRLKDVRQQGSGNAGMTNMLRVYGKKAALLTVLGDMGKAILAVIIARLIFRLAVSPLLLDPGYLTGLFVLIGHIFPVYFAFRGGKGVMPALGIILWVNPLAFLILLFLAVPIYFLSRTMSVVSLINTLLLPVVTWLLSFMRHQEPLYDTGITILFAVLVIWSHRENIRRLFRGEEKKIDSGAPGK